MNSLGDQFKSGIRNFTTQAKNFAQRISGQELSESATLGATVIGAFVLFIVLSPGAILNLPPNTKGRCDKQIPFPVDAAGVCETDGTYTADAGDDAFLKVSGQMDAVCTARKNCQNIAVSGYTSWPSIVVHAFVFTAVIYFLLPRNKPRIV